MHRPPVLVAVPMATEMDFLRPLEDTHRDRARFLVTGVGEAAAPVLARSIAEVMPASILGVGFAGGLDPLLHAGDLVVATRFLASDEQPALEADHTLAALLIDRLRIATLPFVTGAILTVEEPLLTVAAKAVAFGRSLAVAVDMETNHLAHVAAEAGIPFVAARAVVDSAGDPVPAYLAALATADRRTRVRTVVSQAVRRPRDVAVIAALAKAVRIAGPRLHTMVEGYLDGA